jgi:hypothetical protein
MKNMKHLKRGDINLGSHDNTGSLGWSRSCNAHHILLSYTHARGCISSSNLARAHDLRAQFAAFVHGKLET